MADKPTNLTDCRTPLQNPTEAMPSNLQNSTAEPTARKQTYTSITGYVFGRKVCVRGFKDITRTDEGTILHVRKLGQRGLKSLLSQLNTTEAELLATYPTGDIFFANNSMASHIVESANKAVQNHTEPN